MPAASSGEHTPKRAGLGRPGARPGIPLGTTELNPTGHRDYRQPPERKSQHARIVRDIGMRIVAREFAPGDRLPGEAALLTEYEISRPVLREAVRVLVAKGLVQSRQRAGATVRPRSDWHLLDPD